MAANNKTYAPLPFSYLTGGSAPEKSPTYGVKTSTSQEDAVDPGRSDNDPYSIYAGKANQPAHAPIGNRKSMDVTDPNMDVPDPYLLSMGRANIDKDGHVTHDANIIASDPRYRDSVPSESEGDNVFFRPPEGSKDNNQRPGYTNPALEAGDDDTMNKANKKLPRYRVGTDSVYQYYSGSESSAPNNTPQNQDMLHVPPSGQQPRAPSPGLNVPKGGMDSANNPIWDKYYAGTPPTQQPAGTGYDVYRPNSPTTQAVRPTNKDDDFNTLIRNSRDSDSGKECCGSKRCAVTVAVIVTAIICLGAGFAAGWFIYQTVNPDSPATTTTTGVPGAMTITAGGVRQTTQRPDPAQTTPTTTTTTTTSTTLPTTTTTSTTAATTTSLSSAAQDVTTTS